jgi:hypothetical protein
MNLFKIKRGYLIAKKIKIRLHALNKIFNINVNMKELKGAIFMCWYLSLSISTIPKIPKYF